MTWEAGRFYSEGFAYAIAEMLSQAERAAEAAKFLMGDEDRGKDE